MQLNKRAPHLWRKGRQPVGKIRINWNHPLTRGLKMAVMPSQGYYDLVYGQPVLRNGAVYTVADSAGVVDFQSATTGNGEYLQGAASSTGPNAVLYDLPALTVFTLMKNRSNAGNSGSGSIRRCNGSGTPYWYLGLWRGSYNGISAGFGTFSDTPAASNFDTTAKFYAIALTGDGTTATTYVDGAVSKSGAYTPPTYTYNGTSGLAVNWGSPNPYAAGTNSNMALSLFWDHALSAAEIRQISRDPYCIFEPVAPQMIGVTVAGGGTAYSASLALGIQMATNDNARLAATGAVSLGMAAGVSEAGNMAAISALTLGLQAGLSDNAVNALAGAVSLGATLGLGEASILGAQAALSLGAILGFTTFQGAGNYFSTLSLGVVASTGAGSGLQAVSSLALGLGLSITSASIDAISGSLSLGVIAGAGINAGATFNVNIPLGLIAGLQSGGGQSYGASLALGLVVGQAIAAATGLQVTPTERVLRIQAENRNLVITVENRILVIAVENRNISIKLE